ncbi:MAG: alpha/beta fold hydrolase [Bacilli bacterium]|jgi:alpha-beta hydrolase superfamily lysophospholipase
MAQNIKMVKEDKTTVYGIAWTVDNPIGNVVIATGMEEHSVRYDDFATFLNENGYNVYCLDYYGQGRNVIEGGENLGEVPQSAFRKYVYTLYEMIKRIKISILPVYLLGHSMGSFHVQDFMQRFGGHVDKVILSGTNGKDFLANIGYFLARITTPKRSYNKKSKFIAQIALGNYQRSVKNRKTKSDWISTDEEVVAKYEADPLSGKGSTKGFYKEMLKGIVRLPKKKFMIKIPKQLPVLLIAGQDDPVGHYGKGVKKLAKAYEKVGLKNVTVHIYPNMRHEVLNEIGNEQVYQDVLEFLKA